jgi:putative PIN family toxin of toxin-antitoxin system
MRIFIDANVIVSGMVFEGNERKSLTYGTEKKILVTSEHIIEEVRRTMEIKFPQKERIEEFLSILGIEVVEKKRYSGEIEKHAKVRSRKDRHVLACASVSKCEYIVTGDKDLLSLGMYIGIKIVSTKEFMKKKR